MSAVGVLAELRQAGLEVVPAGDSLRLRGNVAGAAADLLDRAKSAKPEILIILGLRERLLDLAVLAGIELDIVHELEDADVAACKGESDSTLTSYLAALARRREMAQGIAPQGWTAVVECRGCGPVLLWPECPPEVIACPWCRHRKAGTAIPTPPPSPSRQDAHEPGNHEPA